MVNVSIYTKDKNTLKISYILTMATYTENC